MSLRRAAIDAASNTRPAFLCRACRYQQIHHDARPLRAPEDQLPSERCSQLAEARAVDSSLEIDETVSSQEKRHRNRRHVHRAGSAGRSTSGVRSIESSSRGSFHAPAIRHDSRLQHSQRRPSTQTPRQLFTYGTIMRSMSTLENVKDNDAVGSTLTTLAKSETAVGSEKSSESKAAKKKKQKAKAKDIDGKQARSLEKTERMMKAAAFSAKLQAQKAKELESKAKRLQHQIRVREATSKKRPENAADAAAATTEVEVKVKVSDVSSAMASVPKTRAATKQPGVTEEASVAPRGLTIDPVDIPQPPVPYLQHGLDRVLFNPGVYHLQDPISRVWNFDPYLEKLMPVAEFDFDALKVYKTSSQDTALSQLAQEQGRKYIGSTSSMTTTLSQFHFLLSNFRPINFSMMSSGFMSSGKGVVNKFTKITKAPAAIFLRLKNGSYAIDYDKQYDSANVLMLLGKSLELLLTLPKSDYEIYRKSDPRTISEEQKAAPESYQYTTMGDFLMRSQLDAYDPRLPGNGTFDLKTRAVLPVRMDSMDYEPMSHYEIQSLLGLYNSYEREFYDMCRATMLKYMLQARMGRMTGIFVAYHNVTRMFGFQYLPIHEMDHAMHGQTHPCLGDQEFKASLNMLNHVFEKATAKFPGRSLRFHFEAKQSQEDGGSSSLHIFAEPMDESQIDEIQSTNKASVAEAERILMGLPPAEAVAQTEDASASVDVVDSDLHFEADTPNAFDVDANAAVPDEADENAAVVDAEHEEDVEAEEAVEMAESENDEVQEAEDAASSDVAISSSESTASTDNLVATDLSFDDSNSESVAVDTEASQIPPTSGTTSDADVNFRDRIEDLDTNLNQNLFYATIVVQNTVNGSIPQHNRPTDLKSTDEWTIDYLLKEYTITKRTWALYEDVKQKRKTTFGREIEDADLADGEVDPQTRQLDFYISMLRDKAAEGRRYRAALDKLDASRDRVIFETPLPRTDPDDVKVDDVGSYTEWLFSGKK